MSLQSSAKTLALTSSSLVTFFTGGILTYADLKEAGLTRVGYPAAFDSNGILKPTLIFKERNENPTNRLKDENRQATSVVQALEVWYYDAPSGSYTNLENQRATVYGLLHDRGVGGMRTMRREKYMMERDRQLGNAITVYDVYDAHGVIHA